LTSLRTFIQQAREALITAGIDADEATLDAELLARHALGWDRATLIARLPEAAPEAFEHRFRPLVERRLRREPMAYILGIQEFWGRDFHVASGVLIPRPETELLVEEALAWAGEGGGSGRPLCVVDVGTGSGCLAITMALELPRASVHATDISSTALRIAEVNARDHGAEVQFHSGALLSGVPSALDLIVSNPPYVTRHEYAGLPPEVRAFEPESALVAGEDGLAVIRALLEAAGSTLRRGGRLLMEIGYGQAEAVTALIREQPALDLLRIRPDLQGIPRAVVAARGDHDLTASG
jgi:release factor glutamine methyltransferase